MTFGMLAHFGRGLLYYKCRCRGMCEPLGCWIGFQFPVHARTANLYSFCEFVPK